ncbi:MAG: iron-sulfur cluster assembly protein IscA [Pseudomonadota bacterium]|jgi:iron-sulfur cluster assembly protein
MPLSECAVEADRPLPALTPAQNATPAGSADVANDSTARPAPAIMSVTLTEAAARHVSRYISRRGKGVGVRLGVKTTGCSGLAYKLEYADEIAPEDHVFEGHGVKILIDPKSLPYLEGTELDFVREGLNEGFKFRNPRERDRCGCGESFRV